MRDVTSRTHLKVDQNTTMEDLKAFTDKLDGKQSVRAVKTKEGTFLYAKTGASSGVAKFFGIARRRRELAQTKITEIMQRHHAGVFGKADQYYTGNFKTVMQENVTGLYQFPARTPRGDTLKLMIEVARGYEAFVLPKGLEDPRFTMRDDLGQEGFDEVASILAGGLSLGVEDINGVGQAAGERLAQALKDKFGDDRKGLEAFILKNGAKLQLQMKEAVVALTIKEMGFEDGKGLLNQKDSRLAAMVRSAMERGFSDALDLPEMSRHHVEIDGEVYLEKKELARGGYGVVSLFENGDGKEVVVKFALPGESELEEDTPDYSSTTFVEEMLRHQAAQGDPPHDNIVKMIGGFRTGDGGVGIILEKASHGTGFDAVAGGLDEMKKGSMTKEEFVTSILTAFKDVATGIGDMQERGVTHGDIKDANIFNYDGVFKIADMGTAQTGGTYSTTDSSVVATPKYLPPERVEVDNSIGRLNASDHKKSVIAKTNEMVARDFPDDQQGDVRYILEPVARYGMHLDKQEKVEEIVGKSNVTTKSDTWQMGVMLFEMLTGTSLPKNFVRNRIEDEIAGFKPGMKAVGEGSYFGKTTGDPLLDDLINSMLVADPEERPTMNEVLKNPIFHGPDIGSKESRERLVDMSNKYQQKIEHQKQTIKRMDEPPPQVDPQKIFSEFDKISTDLDEVLKDL